MTEVTKWMPERCRKCGAVRSVEEEKLVCEKHTVEGKRVALHGTDVNRDLAHDWHVPPPPSAAPSKSLTEAAMRSQETARPEGEWGWTPAELPKGALLVYDLGRWYRSGRGVEFFLALPPRRVTGRPGYWVGSVLFRDGHVDALVWGPQTRALTWWERFLRWIGVKPKELQA